MPRLKMFVLTGTALLFTLSGCAAAGGEMTPTPTSGRPPFQSMPPLNPSSSPTTASAAQLTAITNDLAGRGVTGELKVLKAIATTWNDGSWGCPEAGKLYTQALVPGTQIVVSVAGQSYDYRFGTGDALRLCEAKK